MSTAVIFQARSLGWFARLFLAIAATAASATGAWGQSSGRKDSELGRFMEGPVSWLAGEEGRRVADNIVSYQAASGGWPKNTDTVDEPYTGERSRLEATFDNGATTGELRFLARIVNATGDSRYRDAFIKGFDYILEAQYPNGGWPQTYPPHKNVSYQRYITFNDDAMTRLMRFLRRVANDDEYRFLEAKHRQAAQQAFDRGIDCILKCQIRVDGKLTGWCAQHDEEDFSPRPARSFELASLSGCESVGILQVLMSVKDPSPQVIEAVQAAVAWLEAAKISGMRVERVPSPAGQDLDRVVVEDAAAGPIWARFYEIGTNRPLFADRDGVPKYRLADIGFERRSHYNWLDSWPKDLLETDYPAWKARLATRHTK